MFYFIRGLITNLTYIFGIFSTLLREIDNKNNYEIINDKWYMERERIKTKITPLVKTGRTKARTLNVDFDVLLQRLTSDKPEVIQWLEEYAPEYLEFRAILKKRKSS